MALTRGLYDTSLLLYLQPKPEAYVRNNYKTVTPHPGPVPGPPGIVASRGIGVSRAARVSRPSRRPWLTMVLRAIRALQPLNLARR